ncbi:MAG: carbamoyltransferase, partial [Chloroflexi bacterium]|nr:carbamoyltransferase [Chloroflexota bacterium]
MYILGINAFHAGASACLIRDGELIAAAEEERFRRSKYWAGFPSQAIRYCLTEGGIRPQDLDHVGISRDPSANLHKKVLFALRRRPDLGFVRDRLANAARVRDPRVALAQALGTRPSALRAEFHHVEHHRAHMASAFFVSPFRRAAILSVDGMGDFVSTMWGYGDGERMRVLGEINFPHSLGIFYTAVSQWLGFTKYGDEGKVMGLAPYGQPRYVDRMRKVVSPQRDGTFELNMDAFLHHAQGVSMTWDDGSPTLGTLYSPRFVDLFGSPKQAGPNAWTEPNRGENAYYADVAASLQATLEEAGTALLSMLRQRTGQTALCIAGGVGLNSTFNGKIRKLGLFEDVFVQPAASDAGTSLGVAFYI